MNDITCCPICGNKLRNTKHPNKYLVNVNKKSDYIERVCSNGTNHVLVIYADEKTRQVDLLTLSLNPKYSRFVQVNFHNQTSHIHCWKDGQEEIIDLPAMLNLDFPHLTELKEKISLYIAFS